MVSLTNCSLGVTYSASTRRDGSIVFFFLIICIINITAGEHIYLFFFNFIVGYANCSFYRNDGSSTTVGSSSLS
jgi:hypothetical protein